MGGISLSLVSYALDGGKTSVKGEMSVAQGNATLFLEGFGMTQRGAASFVNGQFTMEPKLENPEFLILTTTDPIVKGFNIYVNPGDDITVAVKDTKITFSGKGAELNQFYVDLCRKYSYKAEDLSPKEVYNQRMRAIRESTLADVKKNQAVLLGFTQGEYLNAILGSYMESKVSGTTDVISKASMDDLDISLLPEITQYYNWYRTINELMYAKMESGTLKVRAGHTWLADFANTIQNQALRETYIVQLLGHALLEQDVVIIHDLAKEARPLVKNVTNLTKIDNILKNAANVDRFNNALPGTDFSAFTFQRPDGTKASIADYKGKIILIDVWSTWCKPCIAEIPFLKKLEHEMAGKDVVFLSISGDSKEEYWQNFLKKRNMTGEQLWMTGALNDPFFEKVGKTGIPRFLVLDAEGKMINAKCCLRPSNPVLQVYLDELIEKQAK